MNINLHIDRLILDGISLSPSQQRQLQTAVETELSRLITETGLADSLASSSTIPTLSADSIHVAPQPHPTQLGTQIAQAVYRGIGS